MEAKYERFVNTISFGRLAKKSQSKLIILHQHLAFATLQIYYWASKEAVQYP